jgi:hypothetical protein
MKRSSARQIQKRGDTVGSPFNRLNLDRQLACEFLAVFARYEFALKAVGFADGDAREVKASWDRYSRAIDAQFTRLVDEELNLAVDYLLREPPKKQILVDGRIRWVDAPPDPHLPRTGQVLGMVRRVRNNLFHGGKFLVPPGGGERDELLVTRSLVVLRACLRLNADVAEAYAH